MTTQMKEPLARCNECIFDDCRYVPSSGPEKASLVIVGEGPGSQEVIDGMPFSASDAPKNAGYVLWHVLGTLGIERDDVFTTNVVQCRPPNNRTPTNSEVVPCEERLWSSINSRDPQIVLMLGNTALRALTGTRQGITAARIYDWKLLGSDALGLATFHPAALFRQGDLWNDFEGDLKTIIGRLKGNVGRSSNNGKFQYAVMDNISQIADLDAMAPLEVAVDIETSGFNPREDFILCISVAWEGHAVVLDGTLLESPEAIAAINRFLARRTQTYHNGPFDVAHLREAGNSSAKISDDTMMMSYDLDERKGIHGLKVLSKVHLGVNDYEGELKQYLPTKQTSYANIPISVLYPYAARDAYNTWRIRQLFKPQLVDGLDWVYDNILIPGSNALLEVERRGILIDREHLETLDIEYRQRMRELEERLAVWGGPTFNPRSPQQVHRVMQDLALPPVASTNRETLETIDHAFAETLLDYRKVAKLQTTYVDSIRKLVDDKGRVYPQYLLHGTVTGRLATTKPALHTTPRVNEIRNLYAAPPGWSFVEVDYDQHEWRMEAFYSGDEQLLAIFRAGRKLHAEVATELYGPDYDHEDYMKAKMVNFGILYGREAFSLAMQLGCTIAEAQAYIDGFFARMPGVKRHLVSVANQAVRTGELRTIFGRRRRFGLVTQQNYREVQKQANNFLPQSTATDVTFLALIRLESMLDENEAQIIGFVHDELLFYVRNDVLEKNIRTIKDTMESIPGEYLKTDVPFKADVSVGTHWGNVTEFKLEDPNRSAIELSA